jgi:hypothetical protein
MATAASPPSICSSKRVRRAARLLVLLAALVLTGCGFSEKEERRDAVNDYLDRVEAIQHRFAPSFKLANDAYRDFSKGEPTSRQLERLRGAEVSILAARDSLRKLEPPADARKLHRDLIRLYNLNASIGLEVITLQRFLPGVRTVLGELGRVNESYRDDLSSGSTTGAQAAAIDAYSGAVEKVVRRFRRLAASPALRPWKNSQVTRLEQVVQTGRDLARALRAGDRAAVAALVKRFRFLLAHQPNVSQAQHNAVKAYNKRLIGISKLQGEIAAEHQRLQNLLG